MTTNHQPRLRDLPPGWPEGQYRVIYLDPPWKYRESWGNGAAEHHYATLTPEQLAALPVGGLALPDAALFLWVTAPQLDVGIDLLKAWGFSYKTVAFTWVKRNRDKSWFMGLGYYTRGNAEFCLLGVKGRMAPFRKAKDVFSLVDTPRREHSRKPAEIYDRIERLYNGPFCELFARTARKGWDSWGNQIDAFPEQLPLEVPA